MLPSPTPNYSGFQKWMPRSLGKKILLLMMGFLVLMICATGFIEIKLSQESSMNILVGWH